MKALLLAGGLGTRLRPLTYSRPKHLLPIANRPHIEHVFELLERHGIGEAVFLTSYLAEAFEPVVAAARRRGLEIEVTFEQEPLGTAGAIKNAEPLLDEAPFLVFNADILTDTDLDDLVSFHNSAGAEATILLTPVVDPSAYGVVPTDDEGRVLGFIEKPARDEAPTNLINAGVYVMEPSILNSIPGDSVYSAELELFPQLVDGGARLYARSTDAYWIDIGTPDKYLRANLDALAGVYSTDAVDSPGADAVCAAPGAEIAPGAKVRSASIGAGVRLADGAVVEESVLLPGAEVLEGATVRRSILGEGARVAAGASAEGLTVGDQEVIDT